MPNRPARRRQARRTLHGADQLHLPRRQHLQGPRHQRRAEHPGGVRRLRPRPQRLPAHLRPDADLLRPARAKTSQETVGRKMARRDRPPIQRCLRRGDEIVVQIIKEGIGTKGPTLSTYLSIPGRILVMMPGMGKMGVSQKIEDDEERRRLRQILDRPQAAEGRRLHHPHRRHRQDQDRDRARSHIPHPPLGERSRKSATAAPARRALHRRRSRHPHRARCVHHRRRPHRRRQQGRRQAGQRSHQASPTRAPRTRSSCTKSRSRCSTSTASSAKSS